MADFTLTHARVLESRSSSAGNLEEKGLYSLGGLRFPNILPVSFQNSKKFTEYLTSVSHATLLVTVWSNPRSGMSHEPILWAGNSDVPIKRSSWNTMSTGTAGAKYHSHSSLTLYISQIHNVYSLCTKSFQHQNNGDSKVTDGCHHGS